MNRCRWLVLGSFALMWTLGGVIATLGQPPAQVDLKVVKYAELARIVASHKGKVVYVDMWSTG